jgi:hypothetical protein
MDKRVREKIPLVDLKKYIPKEDRGESINYYLKYDELIGPDGREVFTTIQQDESDHDQEKNSYWVSVVLQRTTDGKFFSWGWQESPWWNADSLSPKELEEVFPRQVMTIYE